MLYYIAFSQNIPTHTCNEKSYVKNYTHKLEKVCEEFLKI